MILIKEKEKWMKIIIMKGHHKNHIRFPGSKGPKGPYLFDPPPTARPPLLLRACVWLVPMALLVAPGPVGETGDITSTGAYPFPPTGAPSDSWNLGRFEFELGMPGSKFCRDRFFSLSNQTSSIASRSVALTVFAEFNISARGKRTPVGGGGYAGLFSL